MPRKPLRQLVLPIGPSIAYVPLTQGKYALIDSDDAGSVGKDTWSAQQAPHGSFYAVRNVTVDGRCRLFGMAHQILSPSDGNIPDHKSGNTLDNRRANLREATSLQNNRNARRRRDNTSGYKGVSRLSKTGRTPVFSERELSNIRSTRKLCGNCHGRGSTVEKIPTRFARKNYANGFATYLVRCGFCDGLGTMPSTPATDGKLAASGGAR